MNLNEFARLAHKNAAEHGWYDTDPTDSVIFANIMGEWAEAFEEYKAGRGDLYYHCKDTAQGADAVCEDCVECYWRKVGGKPEHCTDRIPKPEGIAAELIDGAIRILDYMGWQMESNPVWDVSISQSLENLSKSMDAEVFVGSVSIGNIPRLVCELNKLTGAGLDNGRIPTVRRFYMLICIWLVFEYCRLSGLNPEKLMMEKHEFNKGRSYRHGGKVC